MKKKFEWSKLFCGIIAGIFGAFSLWSIAEYYSLAQMAIMAGSMLMPDATVAVTCITVVIGSLSIASITFLLDKKNSNISLIFSLLLH